MTRGGACILCALQLLGVLALTFNGPRARVDVFRLALHVVWDKSTVNATGPATDSHVSLFRDRPVVVDVSHGVNVTSGFLLCSLAVTCFGIFTWHLCEMSQEDAMAGPFAADNPEVVGNGGVVLWNLVFLALTCALHVLLLTVALSPCSVEYIALVSVLQCTPLAFVCLPTQTCRHSYTQGLGPEDRTHPLPPLGVSVSLLSVICIAMTSLYAALSIQYDPTGFRAQLIGVLATMDLVVLSLGHLWDKPPSVSTIVNARLVYVVGASGVLLATLYSFATAFPTRYTPEGLGLLH